MSNDTNKTQFFDISIAANSMADSKGFISEVNSAFLKIWGFSSRDEIIGKHVCYFLESDISATEIIDTLNKEGVWEGDYIAKKKDGSTFVAHGIATVILDKNGKINGYQSSVCDITKNKEAERQLRNSNEELEQFAYIASHDLQEPLRAISSYCQLLRENNYECIDEEGKQYIDYAIDSSMRMKILIQELLDYSRIGRRDRPFEEINLQMLLEEILNDFEMKMKETKASVIIENEMPVIYGIRFRIKQLLHNLISNSLKFKSDEAPIIRVGCCDDHGDNSWLFYVKDNGIGIEKQYQDRIFGVFKRLYSRDKFPGTGIGLALCKRIVEAHDGRIWVDSDKSEGTYIYFTISKVVSVSYDSI